MTSPLFRPFALLASLLVLLLAMSSGSTEAAAVREGDVCGVDSADFLSFEFLGDARVAGTVGCVAEDDATQTDCFCAPNLDNQESLSEWTWQCGDAVQFGPKADKICPLTVPVPKPQGISNGVTFTEAQLSVPVPCDVNIHPTGHRGNEVCGYSECDNNDDDDGSFSAVCGCVDLGARGVENGGMVWICLHSTCRCGSDDVAGETPAAPAASGAVTATAVWWSAVATTAGAVAMLA